ncbi:enoyl-CoA hydratase/isomerase family protein [Enemella evansiae]|uniref:Enoyl-CoA hydratase n=1 Tax=Enemella evansiae TaxID=2016499 RepID=A0A255GP08_9ACTN|nr:enoyl-CoA hydratase/isomerase family protein [Enemella evansiae]OYO14011.1 enoyl-CoA hydratase [Enemella evansiae]OYO17550.1 enoyl-CoA hydratase [Enemella evansiae]TDO89578.1 enoyl-CoA hydratase [Enemella evansiae]
MAHDSTITSHDDDSIWITLARGERNMLDAELTRWLVDAIREADGAEPVAIVLTGAGTAFCGGADGPHLRETGTAREFADACIDLFELLNGMGTPVIAALNGDALAGGFALACSTDITHAVADARIGTMEATLAGWPWIAQAPAVARLPAKAALTNLLTGIPFDAARARELGLVDEVVDPARLTEQVQETVELLRPGRAAARRGRPMLRGMLAPNLAADLRAGAEEFVVAFG